MFIFIFLFFVLKQAVMILDPLASHPISAFCASFLNKRATPSKCGASSSSCPEYINSPVVNRSWPDWVHRVAQSPSTVRLNLLSTFLLQSAQFSPLPTFFAPSKCRCLKFSWSKEGSLALWLPFGFHRNTSYALVNQALPLPGRKYWFHLLCMFL